jgi:hypothetical protein
MVTTASGKFLPTTQREMSKMIRYSMFLVTIFGLAIFGLTKLAPAHTNMENNKNITVAYETAFSGGSHPVVFEACAREDCSDTAQ